MFLNCFFVGNVENVENEKHFLKDFVEFEACNLALDHVAGSNMVSRLVVTDSVDG